MYLPIGMNILNAGYLCEECINNTIRKEQERIDEEKRQNDHNNKYNDDNVKPLFPNKKNNPFDLT